MTTIAAHEVAAAADSVENVARDMARTFDSAAGEIAHAAASLDVNNVSDLICKVANIQRILDEAQASIAPARLTRALTAELG